MTPRTAILSAAVLCLMSAPLRAQSSAEALRIGTDDLSASFAALAALAHPAAPADLPASVRPYDPIPRRFSLPENCANLPVVSIRDGEIFKNGASLGRNPSSYLANCDGAVAWQDSYGDLYREDQKIAGSVSQYDLSWFGGVLVWKDSSGDLHRGDVDLGRAENFIFAKYTGDVAWKDSWGDLYRNQDKLGRAETYAVAARTGDVAWTDSFGTLHRNGQELGRAQNWQISDRTGDVGWLDGYRNLYKNGAQVGSDVNQFSMREDGKLIWVDSSGVTHSA